MLLGGIGTRMPIWGDGMPTRGNRKALKLNLNGCTLS